MIEHDEVALTMAETGNKVVFSSAEVEPEGTSHIRVLNPDGVEIGYWIADEWQEAPVEVMGAIMGALCSNTSHTGM